MWRTWSRKSRADLSAHRVQALVLFVMLAGGVAVLTMAHTVERSTYAVFDGVFDDAPGAHVWYWDGDGSYFEGVAGQPGVTATSEVFTSLSGELIDAGEVHPAWIWGTDGPGAVSPALLVEGHWPDPARDDEVVIGVGLAREGDLAVGDTVRLVTRADRIGQYTVTGVVIPVFRAPYPQWTPAAVFVSKAAAAGLAGGEPASLEPASREVTRAGYVFGVRLDDPSGVWSATGQVMDHWLRIRSGVVGEAEGPFILLRIFAIFAAIAAGFIAAASVTNHTSAQFREIGLLKAVGVTPRQTTGTLIAQLLALSIPAALAGMAIGIAATPAFLWAITGLLDTSAVVSVSPEALALIFVVAQVLVVASAAIPAWRAGRTPIVESVALGRRSLSGTASRLGRLATWLRLPPVVACGLKDSFSRPVRSWLTVAAIAVAAATLMMAFTFRYSLQRLLDDPALVGSSPFELQVRELGRPNPVNEAGSGSEPGARRDTGAALDLVRAQPDVEAVITRSAVVVTAGQFRLQAYALGGDVEAAGFTLTEGRMFRAAGEVVVGLGLAHDFRLRLGNVLPVGLGTKTAQLTVVGVYVTEENGGDVLLFSEGTLLELDPAPREGDFLVRLGPRGEPADTIAALYAASDGSLVARDLTPETEANLSDERALVPPMTALSVGLAGLAAANLLSSLAFSVRERMQELGTLKAIGFTPRQVALSVIAGVAPLALLGTLVGAPLGWYMLDLIIRSQAENHIPADLVRVPGLPWVAALLLAAFVITLVGSFVPARRAANVATSQALRAE